MSLFNMFRSPGREMTEEEVEEVTKPPRIRLAETSMERIARVHKEYTKSRADSSAQWKLEALPLILDYLEEQIHEGKKLVLTSCIGDFLDGHLELPDETTNSNVVSLLKEEGFNMTDLAVHFTDFE